jgi:hypothetical protein
VVPVRFNPAQPDNAAMNKTVATARSVSTEIAFVGTTPFPSLLGSSSSREGC